MTKSFLVLALCLPFMPLASCAQKATQVESFGVTTAVAASNGLGTNIEPNLVWNYAAAKAAHITWGRFDGNWAGSEVQDCQHGANASRGYSLPANTAEGLANSAAYDVHPMINADFGPPFCEIATGTLTASLAVGAKTASIHLTSGSLAHFVPGQSCLSIRGGYISDKHGYCGTILTGVSGDTLTLAAAATAPHGNNGAGAPLPAGTAVTVNLLLYPPVLPPVNGSYKALPSIVGFDNFVLWLASEIRSYKLTGLVEIWNEPTWPDECWDNAVNCYDVPPPNGSIQPGFGLELPASLITANLPPGVKLNNGYTDKSGNGTLFSTNYQRSFQPSLSIPKAFYGESMHPYPNNPEDAMWYAGCPHSSSQYGVILNTCTPTGGNVGSNWKWMAAQNIFSNTFGGLPQDVTETGLQTSNSPHPTPTQVTNYEMREFLGWQGLGVTPILFEQLYDSPQDFGWLLSGATFTGSASAKKLTVTQVSNGSLALGATVSLGRATSTISGMAPGTTGGVGSYTLASPIDAASQQGNAWLPLPIYKAFQGLMQNDIAPISHAPVAPYTPCNMPRVTGYSGTFPLSTMSLVGSARGNHADSILFFMWQRTYAPSGTSWISVPSPAMVATKVVLPPGLTMRGALDTATREAVPYTRGLSTATGQQTVIVGVSDHPVELQVSPISAITAPVHSCT